MKAVLKLDGLCCANCAAKIEDQVGRIDGVESATVSFLTQKMTINAPEELMDSIIEKATSVAKKIEADVQIKRLKRRRSAWTGSRRGYFSAARSSPSEWSSITSRMRRSSSSWRCSERPI